MRAETPPGTRARCCQKVCLLGKTGQAPGAGTRTLTPLGDPPWDSGEGGVG